MDSIQWETRSIEQKPDGSGWIERRTGFHRDTMQDVEETRPVERQYLGPPLFYVGRAAGDDARWEEIVARKEERYREEPKEELPNISQSLHDYAEQVVRESVGRRTFVVPDLPWKRERRRQGGESE